MMQRLLKAGLWVRVALGLVLLPLLLGARMPALALGGLGYLKHHKPADDSQQSKPASTASQPPAFSIPVEPLGFDSPGAFYLGQRESLVSLDFLDENRLLFTFRAPGLIRRTTPGESDERQIRAEVVSLPQGTVEVEALWTLHDHNRYLWMLHNGHFLLRDGDTIKEGNAALELKPLLQFPGPLLWMQMDPAQQFLVTDSEEPKAVEARPGDVPSPATAEASISTDGQRAEGDPQIVLRILRRDSGQVMLVSRVRTAVHLPINSTAYLETLRASEGRDWLVDQNFFTGGVRMIGKLESTCDPPIELLSSDVALANACAPQGGRKLVAMSMDGRKLWEASSPSTQVWPLLIASPDGSHLARETLTLDQPVDNFANTIGAESIKGQLVEVFETARGSLALKAPASPVLDGGGNVAISPSGKRVAVLNAGSIEVYELAAPQVASSPSARSTP
jgi:hypothetical protein